MSYQVGDVVLCNFPLREDPSKFTLRPALVTNVLGNDMYRCAQITSNDRTGSLTGKWILMNSKEGKQMGLKMDSFVSLTNILPVPDYAIKKLLGNCPIIKELIDTCK